MSPRHERCPSESYNGEWYTPELSAEDYGQYRMKEKGYAAIAMLLHIAVGLLPSMGLNVFYAALFYMPGLLLIVCLTVQLYRMPSQREPLTLPQHRRYVRAPRILVNVQRVLVLLTLIADVIATYLYGLGLGVWFILQLVLLLLEALSLQFLFRLQRELHWEVSATKPAE